MQLSLGSRLGVHDWWLAVVVADAVDPLPSTPASSWPASASPTTSPTTSANRAVLTPTVQAAMNDLESTNRGSRDPERTIENCRLFIANL